VEQVAGAVMLELLGRLVLLDFTVKHLEQAEALTV
jgi:hypothetical protein